MNAGTLFQQSLGEHGRMIWGCGLLAAAQSTVIVGSLAGQFLMEGFLDIKLKKYNRALFTRCFALLPSLLLTVMDSNTQ